EEPPRRGFGCGLLRQRDLDDRVLVGAHGDDGALLVAGAPARGEGEAEGELRVQELVAAEEALSRVVAEDEAVEPTQEALPLDAAALRVGRQRGHLALDAVAAVARVGVRGEPLGHAASAL